MPFFEDLSRFDAHLNMGQQGFKPLTVVSPTKEYVQGHIIQWSRLKTSYYTGSLVKLGHFLHQQVYGFKPCFQKSAKIVKRWINHVTSTTLVIIWKSIVINLIKINNKLSPIGQQKSPASWKLWALRPRMWPQRLLRWEVAANDGGLRTCAQFFPWFSISRSFVGCIGYSESVMGYI